MPPMGATESDTPWEVGLRMVRMRVQIILRIILKLANIVRIAISMNRIFLRIVCMAMLSVNRIIRIAVIVVKIIIGLSRIVIKISNICVIKH